MDTQQVQIVSKLSDDQYNAILKAVSDSVDVTNQAFLKMQEQIDLKIKVNAVSLSEVHEMQMDIFHSIFALVIVSIIIYTIAYFVKKHNWNCDSNRHKFKPVYKESDQNDYLNKLLDKAKDSETLNMISFLESKDNKDLIKKLQQKQKIYLGHVCVNCGRKSVQ